ncbi:MAG: hypothetical protein II937_03880 [Bacteroidales bacterium]|nr:hypothetical protein [Bacteroidales bacterium]
MKRRFLYYSLVAAIAASAVTFPSCNKNDDDPVTTTTTPTDDTKKEVEKFAVNVNLNGETILSQQVEVGKSMSLNLDELQKNPLLQEKLKGYEILSITKDGKEVSGEVEISAESKFEINAIKYAVLEFQLPNEDGKILYASKVVQVENEGVKKIAILLDQPTPPVKDAPPADYNDDARPAEPQTSTIPVHYDYWAYTSSDNKLKKLERSTVKTEDYTHLFYNPEENVYDYEQATGKLYTYGPTRKSAPEEKKYYDSYFFKTGDKYYQTRYTVRYVKSDATVKGYKTAWILEKSDDSNDRTPKSKAEDTPIYTITDEKFSEIGKEYSYDYKNGIITVKVSADNEYKFIYDGTYLYEIDAEYSLIDYSRTDAKINTGKLADITENGYSKIGEATAPNVYKRESDKSPEPTLYGAYDWDTDGQIEIPATEEGYDEFYKTVVAEFDKYPFGRLYSTYYQYYFYIFPDGKILTNGVYSDIVTDPQISIFTDGKYVVIDGNIYDFEYNGWDK